MLSPAAISKFLREQLEAVITRLFAQPKGTAAVDKRWKPFESFLLHLSLGILCVLDISLKITHISRSPTRISLWFGKNFYFHKKSRNISGQTENRILKWRNLCRITFSSNGRTLMDNSNLYDKTDFSTFIEGSQRQWMSKFIGNFRTSWQHKKQQQLAWSSFFVNFNDPIDFFHVNLLACLLLFFNLLSLPH